MSKKLIELRKKLRKKRPSFHREDSHKVIGVKRAWRRAVGRHSKVRHQLKGYVKRVEPGYGSPALIRNSHRSGLFPVIVNTVSDIASLNKAEQGAVIASGIGRRKRVLLLNKAKELNIKVFNVKDIDQALQNIKAFIKARKEKKVEIKKKKESRSKVKKKESEKKPELAEKVESEDKKTQEKKDLDKTLSRRQR